MLLKKNHQLQNLITQLQSRDSNNKNVIINLSTSSYAMMDQQTLQKLQLKRIDKNLNIIIFSSSQCSSDTLSYSTPDKIISITTQLKEIRMKMSQSKNNNNKSTYIYASFIPNMTYNKLDELYFLDCVALFLIEYTGRVILEMQPFFKEIFMQKLKNFKRYFQNSYESQIQFLNEDPADIFCIFDQKTGKNIEIKQIFESQPLSQALIQSIQDGKKIFMEKNIEQLKKNRMLIATNSVIESFENFLKKFNLKVQNKNRSEQIVRQMKGQFDYDFDSPQFQKIIKIYKDFGIICCELHNLTILEASIQQNNDYENFDDYKGLQVSIATYIVDHLESFPLIMTDDPLFFLQGRKETFKYLSIEDNYYKTSTKQKVITDLQLKKIIYRQNNENTKGSFVLYSFTNKQSFTQILQKQKYKMPQNILEYPFNLEKRFTHLEQPRNFSYDSKVKQNQRYRFHLAKIKENIKIQKQEFTDQKFKKIEMFDFSQNFNFKQFVFFLQSQNPLQQIFKVNSQVYKFLNHFDYDQLQKYIQVFLQKFNKEQKIQKQAQVNLRKNQSNKGQDQKQLSDKDKNLNQDQINRKIPIILKDKCNECNQKKYRQSQILQTCQKYQYSHIRLMVYTEDVQNKGRLQTKKQDQLKVKQVFQYSEYQNIINNNSKFLNNCDDSSNIRIDFSENKQINLSKDQIQ